MDALLKKSGIHLHWDRLEQLWTYHQLLRQYNPELNLTRIHNFTYMVLKLYVDSILPGQLMDLPSPLLDLGTGPGMPGIPLKIAYPQLTLLLAESRQKRVAFLKTVVEKLNFPDVEVVGEGITPHFERPVAVSSLEQ
jgi:16S rRNA (guanine527-N7)-methyltransferase